MKYRITETIDSWFTKKPQTKVIKEFNYYFTAWLYKWAFYDFAAEPAWKASFGWKIHPSH